MPQTDMDHLIRYYSSLDLFLNATRYRSLVEGETTASIPEARIVIEDAEAAQKAISNYKSRLKQVLLCLNCGVSAR